MSPRGFGVDGCRAGWFYVALGDDEPCYAMVATLAEVVAATRQRDRVLVDIPIGLKQAGDPGRGPDALARSMLGPRASSVFPAPIRPVLDCPDYPSANACSRKLAGQGLSRQTFNIMDKIREADRLMRNDDRARRRLAESHPEVCFWALAGGRPMSHPKRTEAGFEERLAVLAQHWPEAERLIARAYLRSRRAELGRDDIVDAVALALTARRPASQRLRLPPRPERDSFDLPMQMVYPRA